MSILIKDMEMPKNCNECWNCDSNFRGINDEPITDPCCLIRMRLCEKSKLNNSRPDWCPLIEVPTPHGRLIDGDELYELMDGGYDLDFEEVPETKKELLRMITDAPTIIEAEVENNG